MNGMVQIVPAITVGGGIVWQLYLFISREFEKKNLTFVRSLETPEGDEGYYTAYVSVRNTSPTEKLKDCRCEIIELRDEGGELIGKNIGLRTRGQENKDNQGRFNLDQGATKDVPIFEIDQSRDDDNTLKIINANKRDISLEHGIYTATIRGYGDTGEADEIIVRLDTRDCSFEIVDKQTAERLANGQSASRGMFIGEPINLPAARLNLTKLRTEGVEIRNLGQKPQKDLPGWIARVEDWMDRTISAIEHIDAADAEWFKILDAVPPPRVSISFTPLRGEESHLKAFREHDFRLSKLEKLIDRYASR